MAGARGLLGGGYTASWVIAQTQRFAAAVPLAPVTDWLIPTPEG
ncbi:MAG TPA: prolyl oligopeptidase family serine peptidase [Ktedonobacterales bacterium]